MCTETKSNHKRKWRKTGPKGPKIEESRGEGKDEEEADTKEETGQGRGDGVVTEGNRSGGGEGSKTMERTVEKKSRCSRGKDRAPTNTQRKRA